MDPLFATSCCRPFLLSLSCSLFCNRFAGERRPKHTNLLLELFFFTLISRHSVDTPALLSMHFFVLRISRASEKRRLSHLHHGQLITAVRYHHLSFLQCHSRAKELCVVFAQLLHLHVIMTSIVPTKCLIKKSLWLVSKAPAFSLCLATWTSGMPVSRRSGRLGSSIFLDNCVR